MGRDAVAPFFLGVQLPNADGLNLLVRKYEKTEIVGFIVLANKYFNMM